jgi:hypothetical protein
MSSLVSQLHFSNFPCFMRPNGPLLLCSRCEVRSGPEFVMRNYIFMRNHTFRLLQFHYGDESCTLALYTLTARGRYRLTGRSWVTPGATEAEYTLTRVTATAHSPEVAEELAARVNTTCPGQVRRRWKPYRDYVVLSLPEELAPSNNQPPIGSSSNYQRRNAASASALGESLTAGQTPGLRFPARLIYSPFHHHIILRVTL